MGAGAGGALVAARLSAEHAIGVRHGCFCAHPYLLRLLCLGAGEIAAYGAVVRAGERRRVPGAVRASAGIGTTHDDVERLLAAVSEVVSTRPPVDDAQDPATGDFWPEGEIAGWTSADRMVGASCARG